MVGLNIILYYFCFNGFEYHLVFGEFNFDIILFFVSFRMGFWIGIFIWISLGGIFVRRC